MTRGRCGSLALHRMALSSTTPCRFLPAHPALRAAKHRKPAKPITAAKAQTLEAKHRLGRKLHRAGVSRHIHDAKAPAAPLTVVQESCLPVNVPEASSPHIDVPQASCLQSIHGNAPPVAAPRRAESTAAAAPVRRMMPASSVRCVSDVNPSAMLVSPTPVSAFPRRTLGPHTENVVAIYPRHG